MNLGEIKKTKNLKLMLQVGRALVMNQNKLKIVIGYGAPFPDI